MKTQLIRSILLGIAALSTLALVSCQAPSSTPNSAVSCSQCGTVYFQAPSTSSAPVNKGYVSLKPAGVMDCADCENKVVGMINKVSMSEHTCKTCGGTLRHCSRH